MSNEYAPRYVVVTKDWLKVICLIVLGFLAANIVGSLFFVGLPTEYQQLTFMLGTGVGLYLSIGAFLYLTNRSLDYIDFPGFSARALGIGVLVGLLLVVVQGGLTLLFVHFGVGEMFGPLAGTVRERGAGFLVGLLLMNLIAVAPAEELFYRNLVQKELYRNHSTAIAVLGASFLFGLAHFPDVLLQGGSVDVVALVEILVNALIYGGVYAYFKRIDITIVAHALYNSSVFVIAFFVAPV